MADPVRVTAFDKILSGPTSEAPAAIRNFLPWLTGLLDEVTPEFRNNVRLKFTCTAGEPWMEMFYSRLEAEAQTEEEWQRRQKLKQIAELTARIEKLTAKREQLEAQVGGSP